ncbi:MAG: carboxypeptidase regulatory-like domain-containing protein [Gemmatimonadota bacterium]
MMLTARQPLAGLSVLAVIGVLLAPAALLGQETRGEVIGRVVSDDGAPMGGATIHASSQAMIGDRVAVTTPGGHFRLTGLPTGVYSIEFSRIGYRGVRVEDVPVRLGQVTPVAGGTVTLAVAAVEVAPLVVVGNQPTIDISTSAIATSVLDETFLALPTQRDYRDLALLTPQASENLRGDPVNISGATGLENLTYVDGLNTTDPFFGSLGTKLPYNFVREFQVKTNGYEAQYGGATGGIFNAITQSGGDKWSFSAFSYFNGSGLTADAQLGVGAFVAEGADAYDVGISVGGPLVKDKLWFFGAYDPSFVENRVEIPGIGFFEDELTEHLFAAKFDWRPSDNTDVVFTTFGDPTTHDRVGGGPFSGDFSVVLDPAVFLNRVERGGLNLASDITHRLGSTVVLDFSVGGQWNSAFDGPRPGDDAARYVCIAGTDCAPGVPPGAIAGGFGEQFSYDGKRLSARLSAFFLLGSHSPEFGVEYEDYSLSPYASSTSGEGVILDEGPNTTSPSRWFVIVDSRQANLHGRVPTVFAQDSWAVSDRFRLNYGLRWDGQYLIDSEGSVGQSFTDQWQPRVGFVWTPGEPGRQKFTGSVGRFYQRMPLRIASGRYVDRLVAENSVAYYDDDPRLGGQQIDPTFFAFCCQIEAERDLKGTHYDEITLGYERAVSDNVRLGAHGIHRTLREVVNFGVPASGPGFPGNPGRGDLSNLDSPQRDYWALELTADYLNDPRLRLSASYVLSRNYGNFPGQYNSDTGFSFPNANGIFEQEVSMIDNEGLLPNDSPHRLKMWGSYDFDFGLTAGTFFSVQSGAPISRYQAFFGTAARFLSPRGSEGRYSALWDWNLRLQYPIGLASEQGWNANLIADLLHIGNPQTVGRRSEVESFGTGGPVFPNVAFGEPIVFQPPFTVRLGLEIGF